MLTEGRSRGIARAVDNLLSAMTGFDPDWDGVVAQALRGTAAQLSADLGYKA